MKLTTTSAALILACICSIQAAPTNVGSELAVREVSIVQGAIDNMDDYVKKRDLMSEAELMKRESQIVTDVLTAIKNTNLAPGILEYFISDPTFKPIVIDTIVWAIKNNVINLDTLLKSLNDSGLAVDVIQNLIEDCTFYEDIYKLALNYISDLAGKIADSIGKKKREFTMVPVEKSTKLETRASEEEILTSLMESLKNSGLANQVVRQLIVDPDFYSFGSDLIEKLIDEDAISLGDLVDALLDSGLIPSLMKAFLNLGTFNTVITNALAAAFGKCDASSVTTLSASTTASITSESALPSPTSTAICRKKKRSYNY